MTLRVALAGAGMVSRHHLLAWSRVPDVEIVAIADPDIQAAEQRAGQFAIPAVFADPGEMLADAAPDALDIATPVDTHGALIELGCSHHLAGILCQKPLASSLDAAREIVRRLEGQPTRVMIHENWRFRPHFQQIHEWLQSESIGRPCQFLLNVFSSGLLPRGDEAPPALMRQPFMAKMPRLIVLELLIHHLDMLQALLGAMSVRSADLARLSDAVMGEDTATIVMAGNDAFGTINASLSAKGYPARPQDYLQIIGSEGRIVLDGPRLELFGEAPVALGFDHDQDYQASYDAAIRHFVDALAKGTPFATSPTDHLQILLQIAQIYELGGAV
ncbi:Gfo/Idh/MocA family protein [Roseibium aggregatum]|jgi:predicted dehydrogenase|uniref:Gfo/Idh/MocA family protein n=1 Tax=Roseibium aggregatum TaxID=187304 RepID=UPI001E2871A3|nr:Gfo/Idh/MocA family oxidoreductase [Roseibium aggregatum]UES41973.1 gfo/Idh/MocA family oxidoreductase [Roseibium aggregatum]